MNFKSKTYTDMDQLMKGLKTKDLKYSKITRNFQIVYSILIPILSITIIIDLFNKFSYQSLIQGGCMIIGMLIFVLIFRKYHKEYKNVDYAAPTLLMLQQAAKRYKPFRKEIWWALLAVVLIGMGNSLNHTNSDYRFESQLFYLIAIIVGLAAGLILWYFKYKPIRDSALRLIKEIETN